MVELSVPDSSTPSTKDVVTCSLNAQRPNYSGSTMTGTGGILGCIPHRPQACNSEVDIELWAPGPGRWITVASSARQYACPPPYRNTTAAFTCEWRASDPFYYYRTRVLATIVEDGIVVSNDSTSESYGVRCL
ncbi:hypothetical protein AB0D29_36705 [Streptomyces sp. NPDC048424]|uniref:hypothetical protein n=1 Tax=Streptomyces sp. NPDC048424 TaxID=3155265 RepID=UPI003439EDD8